MRDSLKSEKANLAIVLLREAFDNESDIHWDFQNWIFRVRNYFADTEEPAKGSV